MRFSHSARLLCGLALGVGALGALEAGTAAAATPAGTIAASHSTQRSVTSQPDRSAGAADAHPAPVAPATAPTPSQLAYDHRHGIVPRGLGASGKPGGPGQSAPCEIACSSIHMSYFDGPVLSSAKVEGVFWGTGNYTAGAQVGGMMPGFYNAVGTSDWWAGLTEYNTLPGGTHQLIGPVTSLGETTISPALANDGSSISDAQIQTELGNELTAGHLPAPALDNTGNVATVYALYFPDSKLVCLVPGECNDTTFCAYHNSFSYKGLDVPYMVLPAFTPGTADSSGCGTLPTLTDDFTSTVSHELVEAATDTGIGLDAGALYQYPAAWGDNNNNVGEIMDACDSGVDANSALLPGTSDYVQAIFSNAEDNCVFSKPYYNLNPIFATTTAGVGVAYTATTLGPTNANGSTTFTISPTSGGSSCTGNVCTPDVAGNFTVTGHEGSAVTDTVQLTATPGAQCQPGTYSTSGNAPCTSAPPGSFVASAGATSATLCALGSYNPFSGQTSCTTAPAGTYVASTGATAATLCAAGSYNPSAGSTSSAACQLAPPGTYVPSPGAASATNCAAGSFSALSGATSCSLAGPGFYVAQPGSQTSLPCEPGSYSASPGAVECALADPGSYVPGPQFSIEIACAAGSFSASAGATQCAPADPGSYVPGPGSSSETLCAAGSYNPAHGATACTLADPGSYVDVTGGVFEIACDAGSFSAAAGAAACALADPGSFVASTGASAEAQCAAGSFSASTGATACALADPGSFVADVGSSSETPCAAGSFSSSAGATACTLAPPGSYVPLSGATQSTKCAAGSYSASSGASACTSASPGSDVPGPGASSQSLCAAGSFSAASGAVSCTLAAAGSYVGTAGASTATECALGTYNPATGATSCLVAPKNTYVATVGATAATVCPSHTFTLKTGSTSKADCLYIVITSTSLHGGTLYSKSKVLYRVTLKAKGGTRPYAWTLVPGSKLPPGLTLDKSTGVISGKATKLGKFSFTVKVLDTKTSSQGQHGAEATLTITITK